MTVPVAVRRASLESGAHSQIVTNTATKMSTPRAVSFTAQIIAGRVNPGEEKPLKYARLYRALQRLIKAPTKATERLDPPRPMH